MSNVYNSIDKLCRTSLMLHDAELTYKLLLLVFKRSIAK